MVAIPSLQDKAKQPMSPLAQMSRAAIQPLKYRCNAENVSYEPICMYRLLFASNQLHVFWKSLICIRPLYRLKYFAVALLGVRTRRCLISDLTYNGHLGSQTLGAPYSVPCS